MREAQRARSRWQRLSLLLILGVGLAIATIPVARAASGKIILEIAQAEATEKGTDCCLWWAQQDFYPKMTIESDPLQTGPERAQRDWAAWEPTFRVEKEFLDISAMTSNIIHGQIELWDNDDIDPDDQFDINPDSGRALPLEFNVCTVRFNRSGDATQFTSTTWMPQGFESDPARVQVRMRTADGKPFLPNNISIADATPVQTVYHPRSIIHNKATALMVELTSSHPGPVEATLNVQMFDGATTVTDSKTVTVPPEGIRVFFFDGSGTAAPFKPQKQPNHPSLDYDIDMNVPADSTSPDPSGPFPNCVATQDNTFSGSLPVIKTASPTTLYVPWDWNGSLIPGETIVANPPTVAQVATTFATNERFRKAIFPIDDTISAVFPGRATSPKSTLEPAMTMLGWSIATHAVGIDRLVLMPRKGWFAENNSAGRLTFGTNAIGMSLAEYAPHAVIAEQGFSEVAVHEFGHSHRLSQHNCSTGGLAETLLGVGCRDEYNHTAADGRPYLGSGYDVLGNVYPSGNGGTPGTREVLNITNIMDTAGPRDDQPYDRWIDNTSYDWLSEQLRKPQDPPLINLSGYIHIPGGLKQPSGAPLLGTLLNAYRYDGTPDLPEAALGSSAGAGDGQFYVRLVTGQGDRLYRFTPAFDMDGAETQEYGFFSFAVPWDDNTTQLELVGPSTPADFNNQQASLATYATIPVSQAAPTVTKLRAAIGVPPDMGAPTYTPPTATPIDTLIIAWDQQDSDTASSALRTMLYITPPKSAGNLAQVAHAIPVGINIIGGKATLSADQFAALPGDYGGRVVISDGVNTTTFETPALFRIQNGLFLPLLKR